nr:AC4 [Tomato leaf curl New Delhi virus]UYO78122.1 AC4 [Tomato leaf curl New Delhi virus]
MGNLIYTCSSSSKENHNVKTTRSSTCSLAGGQHISIRTFRELNQRPSSKHTSTKTETF